MNRAALVALSVIVSLLLALLLRRDERIEELEATLMREEERSLELESIVRTEINCPRTPLLRDVLDELDECLLREAE